MRSRARLVAWSLWALGMLLATALGVLTIATLGSPHTVFGGYPAAQLVMAVVMVTVATLISSRVHRNPIGWLFFLVGFGNLTTNVAGLYAIRGLELAPGSLPFVVPIAWFGTWSWNGMPIGFPLLIMLFPDGAPLSRRWRPVVWLQLVAGLGTVLVYAISSFPRTGWALDTHGEVTLSGPSILVPVANVLLTIVIICMVAAFVSAVIRLRRSRGELRQQLKWFVGSGTVLTLCAAVTIGAVVAGQPDNVVQPFASLLNLGMGLLAVASGFAILRYRLYDIDVVINRTVVYGGLAIAITAVYLGLIVGVGSLVGSRGDLVLTIVATAIVGLAFQPARSRLQRYANRLVYGRRATPTRSYRTSASGWRTRWRPTTCRRGWPGCWRRPPGPSAPMSGCASATSCVLPPPGRRRRSPWHPCQSPASSHRRYRAPTCRRRCCTTASCWER